MDKKIENLYHLFADHLFKVTAMIFILLLLPAILPIITPPSIMANIMVANSL